MLIDNLGNQEYRYEFYICKSFAPFETMACITECSFNRSINLQLMSIDELSLDMANIYSDDSINTSFDLIKISNIIKVETYIDDTLKNTQMFHIYQIDQISGEKDIKSIKCYSLEYRLNKLKIRSFKKTTYLYKNTVFDMNNPLTSGIMDYILSLLEGTWSVSYVSSDLLLTTRTYDISESNLLDAINTIQSNYNCIFFYNTLDMTIQIKSISELNQYSGIVLSTDNYIKQYKNSIQMDQIYTRLYVTGVGDNKTGISGVNVTGRSYIDNFSSFMNNEYMSSGLISSLTTLNNLRVTKQTDFNNYLSQLATKQGERDTLTVELNTLISQRNIIENHEDTCVKFGISGGQNYTYWHGQYTSKVSTISSKESAITSKQAEIDGVIASITSLSNLVSYETNLTLAQRQELLNFINEKTEKFDSSDANTLMSLGQQLLAITSNPQYDIELDMIDLYSAQSESIAWDKIELGKKVHIAIDELNIYLEPLIVAITHDYDSSTLKVVVSNKTYLNSDLEYIAAIFASSQKSAVTLDNEKDIYKEFDTVKDTVIYDTTPISTTNNPITMEDGSSLLRRGLYMRDSESASGQMKILGDRIVFTKNNWDTISVGINSNGITTDGNFKLISEKTNGTANLLTINGDGIKIYGDGTSENGISIYNSSNVKTLYLGSDGKLKIDDGYIDITKGSNNIKIDPSIGITIKNGVKDVFKVNASTGDIDMVDGNLTGGTITIGSGSSIFKADSNGIYMGSGTFSNAKFSVSPTGILSMRNNSNQLVMQQDGSGNVGLGGKIYQIGTPNNYAMLGGDYGDMALYYNNSEYFRIYNDLSTIMDFKFTTSAYGQKTAFSTNGQNTYVKNNWDFSDANVTGIQVKFA